MGLFLNIPERKGLDLSSFFTFPWGGYSPFPGKEYYNFKDRLQVEKALLLRL